jgi:hypothetical protein
LSAVPAVDSEIRVGGEKHRLSHNLSHADKTGIREAHRNAYVLFHECDHFLHMILEVKRASDRVPVKEFNKGRGPVLSEKVKRFRQCRLARFPGRRVLIGHGIGPAMVGVAVGKNGD